jgi:hypothetical protein
VERPKHSFRIAGAMAHSRPLKEGVLIIITAISQPNVDTPFSCHLPNQDQWGRIGVDPQVQTVISFVITENSLAMAPRDGCHVDSARLVSRTIYERETHIT